MAALHPDDKKRVLGEWTTASWTDSDSIVEYRFLRPDGGVSWIEGFASALRDDSGLVTGWVGSCLDLTTRKRAEDAAAQSSARFQAAFDSAPIGVALTTPDGRWLDVNDALCELTGYSKEDLLATTFTEITHPDDRAASHKDWVQHSAGSDDFGKIEKRYVRADGQIVWVSISRTLVTDADGQRSTPSRTSRTSPAAGTRSARSRRRRSASGAPSTMRRSAWRSWGSTGGGCVRTRRSARSWATASRSSSS